MNPLNLLSHKEILNPMRALGRTSRYQSEILSAEMWILVYTLLSTSPWMKISLRAKSICILICLHWALSREIGIFNNSVKTTEAEENLRQRQQNSHRRPFHWNVTYVLVLTERGIAKYTSFRSLLQNLSPVNNIPVNRNNSSILKCWYRILLFRSFRLMGDFPHISFS